MGRALSPLIVNVVDDDSDVLVSLRFLLEAEGFHVRTFASGRALLTPDASDHAHCCVIDYLMPDINGLELVRLLKNRGIETPVVLMTGSPDETIPQKAAAVGIHHVLFKPHLDENLAGHIRSAILEVSNSPSHPLR